MALMIIAACSGTGKSTIVKALLSRHERLKLSVSHTTRSPRPSEEDGVAYHFVDRSTFEQMIAEGAFVEWAEYAGNLYGTSHAMIQQASELGQDLIFEVEIVGAAALKEAYPQAVSCFLLPPSWEELERRLRGRQTENESVILTRLSQGRREIEFADSFDHLVINEELGVAIDEVSAVYVAHRTSIHEQKHFLNALLQSR